MLSWYYWYFFTFTVITRGNLRNASWKRTLNDARQDVCLKGCVRLDITSNIVKIFTMLDTAESPFSFKVCEPPCPKGYGYTFMLRIDNEKSCYKFDNKTLHELTEAEAICGSDGAKLVSIETEMEMNHLEHIIKKEELFVKGLPMLKTWAGYWTSGFRGNDGVWKWKATGAEIEFFKWGNIC